MNFSIRVLKTLRREYFRLLDPVIATYAKLFRSKSQIRARWHGDDPASQSARAAVYVHYDPQGEVGDFVVHQLRELVANGFRITFVSNSPMLPDESLAKVTSHCRKLIWRFNVGYDFGAYKDGIAEIGDLGGLDCLLIMNDSTYGPFWPLSQTLSAIDRSKVDFWGIVDSWEQRHHIQSFFLVFLATALRSSAFKEFWAALPYVNDKRWIIRHGEVGLSQRLMSAHLRGGVLASYWSVAASMKDRLGERSAQHVKGYSETESARLRTSLVKENPVNPMLYFWDALIEDYKCPFIKRNLIHSNPAGLPATSRWSDVVKSVSGYDTSMIERHLRG